MGILSNYRVSAQPFLPTCPSHIEGDPRGLFAKTFSTNTHVDPGADGKLDIAGNQVLLSCTFSASKFVKTNPYIYQNTFHSLQVAIKNLEQTKTIHCRFEYLFSSDSNCRIILTTNEELIKAHGTASGVYVLEPHIIYMGIENKPLRQQSILLHETIHALDLDSNKLKKSNYQQPYSNEIEKAKYDKIIEKGVNNVNYFYTLFSTLPHELDESEKQLLGELNKLASGYIPQVIFDERESISPTSYDIIEIKTEQGNIEHPLRRIASQVNADGIIETAFIPHTQSPLHSALWDGLIYLHHLSLYPESRYAIEINAYMHQAYEYYPELFEKIFPGLNQYIISRGTKEYQECMKKTSKQDSQYGGTTTLFSSKPTQTEREVTQNKLRI